MKLVSKLLFFSATSFFLKSCNQTNEKNTLHNKSIKTGKSQFAANDIFLAKHSDSCNCSAEFESKDSIKLVHIKNQFYKSKTGHLYEKTEAQREINGHLKEIEYFNGSFSQDVDPLTFEPLDGWYAKDKNYIYYYRPVSGGMQISKLDKADNKTFKILPGQYKYGADKNYFYDGTEIIDDFVPNKTNFKLNSKGQIFEMECNQRKYKFELVN
ncbi:DKNYY domain-containing protein [Chryseobacterium shigense]|uniref:DKNYY family protein n=1 Tax=Chryseobacterium shigense TaxID=297244 RepID=A0A841NP20_9FLAO|nr:DKNYY domain-containing protein [Chryseobacterium shigense]MBB6372475.1 hypothetical protein [Chryseobacterium shigense]